MRTAHVDYSERKAEFKMRTVRKSEAIALCARVRGCAKHKKRDRHPQGVPIFGAYREAVYCQLGDESRDFVKQID